MNTTAATKPTQSANTSDDMSVRSSAGKSASGAIDNSASGAMGTTMNMMRTKNRARRAQRLEGMTLIEILIVVIIMAMIAGAVGVAVLPQFEKSQIKSTKTDAQSVRSAVQLFIIDNPGGCPSMEDLVEGGYVDKGKRLTDAWEQPFQVECDGTDVTVVSSGPDQQMGTEDDIQ